MQPQQSQDPTMPQSGQSQAQPQQPAPQQDPTQQANQSKANLGLINTMQEHLLEYKAKQNGTHASQKQQNAPQSTQTQEITKDPSKEEEKPDINDTLTSFKKEIEGMLDSKLGDIQRELQTMLAEEKDENPEETKASTTA